MVTDTVTDTATYVNTDKSSTSVSTDNNLNANLNSMILDMKELQIIVNEQGKIDDMQKGLNTYWTEYKRRSVIHPKTAYLIGTHFDAREVHDVTHHSLKFFTNSCILTWNMDN